MEQEGTSGIQALDTPVLMYQGKGNEHLRCFILVLLSLLKVSCALLPYLGIWLRGDNSQEDTTFPSPHEAVEGFVLCTGFQAVSKAFLLCLLGPLSRYSCAATSPWPQENMLNYLIYLRMVVPFGQFWSSLCLSAIYRSFPHLQL